MDSYKNVIILTSGLAGSSVLASLFATSGYWCGDYTVKKSDYDTVENCELVRLNKKILSEVGFDYDWMMRFQEDYVSSIAARLPKLDDS